MRVLLFVIGACFCYPGFAQTDFRKGFIIKHEADTLFGLIDFRTGSRIYRTCGFKEKSDEVVLNYAPADLVGYGFIDDKYFESKLVQVRGDVTELIFTEVLVKGLVSLYRFEDSYFVEKRGSVLQRLTNELTDTEVDGIRVARYSNKHIGILGSIMFDCPSIRSKIQNVTLSEKVLTNLVEGYNDCMGEPSEVFKQEKPWAKVLIGLVGGVNYSNIEFAGQNSALVHLTAGSFETATSPVVGLSLNVLSPRVNERLGLHVDILFLASTYYSYNVVESNTTKRTNYVTIELKQLKFPFGLRYTLPLREFAPYINLGLSATYHLDAYSSWIEEVQSGSVVDTIEFRALDIKDFQFGFWGGIGITKDFSRKLGATLEVRYEHTDGIEEGTPLMSTLSSNVKNVQIVIGMHLK